MVGEGSPTGSSPAGRGVLGARFGLGARFLGAGVAAPSVGAAAGASPSAVAAPSPAALVTLRLLR